MILIKIKKKMERGQSKKRSKTIKQRKKIKTKIVPEKKVNCSSETKNKKIKRRF